MRADPCSSARGAVVAAGLPLGPKVALALVLVSLLVVAPRCARADETPSLLLQPAPAGDRGAFVEGAAVRGHLLPSARLLVDYARDPLVVRDAQQRIDHVIEWQSSLHVLGALSLWHRVAFHIDVPLVLAGAGDAPPATSGATSALRPADTGLGDLRLGGRVRIFGTDEDARVQAALAVAAALWLPTAGDGYAGDGALRGRGALLLELDAPRFWAVADVGARSRPDAEVPGVLPLRSGSALGVGLGAGFYADGARTFAAGTELVAESAFGGGARLLDARSSLAHWLLTARYRVDGGPFEVGGAFGPGFGAAPGAADYRVALSLGYAPETPAPPRDDDDDGIPDKIDACLDLRGVPSGDPLLHGCPDVADRDGDAIPDENDACPTQAGEATFVRRTHGCPKPADTDGDGVPDDGDACPREPGPPPPQGDGCPPAPPPPEATRLEGARIVIAEQVQFETGTATLRPESDAVLAAVARVLRDNPQVTRVEVQGHTDASGPEALNANLGQQRADAVVKWLVDHGIAAARLTARGYGASRPLGDNATEEGRTRNRRVDFVAEQTPPPGAAP